MLTETSKPPPFIDVYKAPIRKLTEKTETVPAITLIS
ncbi:Uncharacterised protein [Escherichia coli]|nr:Uncharacterised protein [Escherichia coli]